jgi:hypothetical protein
MIEINDKIGGLDIKSVHVWSLGPFPGPARPWLRGLASTVSGYLRRKGCEGRVSVFPFA